jgi:hypothetical protein
MSIRNGLSPNYTVLHRRWTRYVAPKRRTVSELQGVTMKMEAICSSETSGCLGSTPRYNPEVSTAYSSRRQNLKFNLNFHVSCDF